jgi:hypothetical protein
MQVFATCCDGTKSSATAVFEVRVKRLAVELSMTLGGSLSARDINSSPVLQRQLIVGVADALGVSSMLVTLELLAYANGRRQLLAVSLRFQILASDLQAAALLHKTAETADFQYFVRRAGAAVQVSSVKSDLFTDTSEGPKGYWTTSQYDTSTLVALIVGPIGGCLALGSMIFLAVYISRQHSQTRMKKRALLQNHYAAPTAPSMDLFPFERSRMHPSAQEANIVEDRDNSAANHYSLQEVAQLQVWLCLYDVIVHKSCVVMTHKFFSYEKLICSSGLAHFLCSVVREITIFITNCLDDEPWLATSQAV